MNTEIRPNGLGSASDPTSGQFTNGNSDSSRIRILRQPKINTTEFQPRLNTLLDGRTVILRTKQIRHVFRSKDREAALAFYLLPWLNITREEAERYEIQAS